MASGSLAYRHHADLEADLTKFGFLVYGGTIRDFHEWEFRAMTRWDPDQGSGEERSRFQVPRLLKGRGIHCRRRLGCGSPGFAGQHTQDHREGEIQPVPLTGTRKQGLYRLGTQIGGMLSRQAGEPMTSYLSRRRRWWRKMRQQDKTVAISESILTICCWTMQGSIDRRE